MEGLDRALRGRRQRAARAVVALRRAAPILPARPLVRAIATPHTPLRHPTARIYAGELEKQGGGLSLFGRKSWNTRYFSLQVRAPPLLRLAPSAPAPRARRTRTTSPSTPLAPRSTTPGPPVVPTPAPTRVATRVAARRAAGGCAAADDPRLSAARNPLVPSPSQPPLRLLRIISPTGRALCAQEGRLAYWKTAADFAKGAEPIKGRRIAVRGGQLFQDAPSGGFTEFGLRPNDAGDREEFRFRAASDRVMKGWLDSLIAHGALAPPGYTPEAGSATTTPASPTSPTVAATAATASSPTAAAGGGAKRSPPPPPPRKKRTPPPPPPRPPVEAPAPAPAPASSPSPVGVTEPSTAPAAGGAGAPAASPSASTPAPPSPAPAAARPTPAYADFSTWLATAPEVDQGWIDWAAYYGVEPPDVRAVVGLRTASDVTAAMLFDWLDVEGRGAVHIAAVVNFAKGRPVTALEGKLDISAVRGDKYYAIPGAVLRIENLKELVLFATADLEGDTTFTKAAFVAFVNSLERDEFGDWMQDILCQLRDVSLGRTPRRYRFGEDLSGEPL